MSKNSYETWECIHGSDLMLKVYFKPPISFDHFNVGREFTIDSVNRNTGEITLLSNSECFNTEAEHIQHE